MFTILIIIFILILINGFFSASEMALVSITPSDLHKLLSENNKNAKVLAKVTKDSTKYLSTIQVAITFAGFLSSAYAGSQLSVYLVDLFASMSITITDGLAVVLITILLSFITLVLGELVPKRIALSSSKKLALFAAPVINIVMIVFKPFVWLLSISTEGVLRLFGIKSKNYKEKITESEIKEMIVYGHIEGLYNSEERNIIQRVFKFDDLTAAMIMTPISEVLGLDIENPDMNAIIDSRYSRIPVYRKNFNNIVGVLFYKDILLELKDKNIDDVDIASIVREPFIILQDVKINELFKIMKESLKHLAFIVDTQNQTEGIVTLEDIVEEIVGNIYDEHDLISDDDETLSEFSYILTGDMLISDINGKLGISIDSESAKFATIEEFVLAKQKDNESEIQINVGKIKILEKNKDKKMQVELVIDEKKYNPEG